MNIDNFKIAFDSGVGGCRGTCGGCNKEYYNSDKGWDFEDGELEWLEENAISLDSAVGYVEFEGTSYVYQCECWHERANKIMGFIDSHTNEIAKYLNAERKRKIKEANLMPVVNAEP